MADQLSKGEIQTFVARVNEILTKARPDLHDTVGMIEYLTLQRAREGVLSALEDVYQGSLDPILPSAEKTEKSRVPVDEYVLKDDVRQT